MRYFNSLPLLKNTDNYGNTYSLRNLLIRTNLIPQLASNPLLFYQYELREGDTPETVANKYYGDSYRYWIVLYGNSTILDPQGDWPLTSQQFTVYLTDKYAAAANAAANTVLSYCTGTIHHYEKIITTYDDSTQSTVVKTVEVDETDYLVIVPTTQKQKFANGDTITYSLSKNAVSIYDYEQKLNESKRNIKLINSTYANQMENQYQSLVST